MKKNWLLLIILFSLSVTTGVYAQKKSKEDKELEKEWKKKLKDMDPLKLKALYDEKNALIQDKTDLNSRVVDLETQLSDKDAEISKVKAQLQENEKQLTDAKTAADKASKNSFGGPMSSNGVVFKVQVGAFKNKDLTKYFKNNKNFSGDVDSDGTKKYTLGFFGDYWEAENFKKYLREMGVKDAWIVAYKDGSRVELKEVLEGATTSNLPK
ncbi:Ezrin/radixin/moesin family protein [Cytophagaceae bacterium DM2B3-1]|uniref:Ezrin/radixin/moesin family protein n=1 Tax=Xanthocytophaga flava TaxID=3048013 RepID=A0AAE3QQ85_9BACT|nr:Ezrin/radixin/moesin family protein [Xanthocytophaga flavus]MDJ1470020.1 Ezrin/radixin/moesin family protein [Xanthocytophaga flavus]MDJ1481438.1 Ezrin/radixin/moesin family protein [Xanthocytophaga flavus]MDJ1491416.1 Ezrin/radixin/moesin family protein [Xanthocytophaga flavus]